MNIEQERQLLADAQKRGSGATILTFLRLSGPGWLQSAITLGGGSLASSLFLGILAGFTMLWLQPLAMILGIIMLSAIGYVTLSTSERPFQAINKHINPVLGWSWALASLAANMVWCLLQYSIATSVLQQNLLPDTLAGANGKIIIVVVIFILTTIVTWCYDSGGWGIRLYEWMLKFMVAMIVLCFAGVVVRISMDGGMDWGAIFAGFIPDFSLLSQPAPGFRELVKNAPSDYQIFWTNRIVAEQRNVMISAAATAVGINMTFLLPYTLLKRGWTREFRGLLRFDLSTGMFVPFVLATSCVILASATQFHPGLATKNALQQHQQKLQRESDLTTAEKASLNGERKALDNARKAKIAWAAEHQPDTSADIDDMQLTEAEKLLALSLKQRDAFELSGALQRLFAAESQRSGKFFADIIFGLGVLGMTLSTITLLMLISGLVICEMLNLPTTGWPYRLGCLAAATGVLGPFIWSSSGFYLAVPTSVFGMALLPVAYLTFFFLMNQKNLLKEDMPSGGRRIVWNLLMFVAAGVATCASAYVIWTKVGWWGVIGVVGLLALALIVHFARPKPS